MRQTQTEHYSIIQKEGRTYQLDGCVIDSSLLDKAANFCHILAYTLRTSCKLIHNIYWCHDDFCYSEGPAFEKIRGGARQVDDPASQHIKLSIGNKYDALDADDSWWIFMMLTNIGMFGWTVYWRVMGEGVSGLLRGLTEWMVSILERLPRPLFLFACSLKIVLKLSK